MVYNKINELKKSIIRQSNRVIKIYESTVNYIETLDPGIKQDIIEKQETKINQKEVKIEQTCTEIIALQHPEAIDLRFVMMTVKLNYDLERIADHCVNIIESIDDFDEKIISFDGIKILSSMVKDMLNNSIASFINLDSELAMEICKEDSIIDKKNNENVNEIINILENKKMSIKNSLSLIKVSNNLERIADLTTNISEETIYIANGKNIKHHKYDNE